MLASIPSPSFSVLSLGPIELHMYGVVIAIGVAIAFSVTKTRFARYGGDPVELDRVLVWTVGFGFLGGRFGYVLTHLGRFFDGPGGGKPWEVIAIWQGGLAFFGGVFLGIIAAYIMLRITKQPVLPFFDAVAIAVPTAQAMGRLGNWFNQELFGGPTDLPWALEIEERFRPDGLESFSTFHPTFLYELLLNMVAVVVIVRLEKMREWKRGSLFLIYLMLYGVIRFLMELLRTDEQIQWLEGIGIPLRNNGLIAIAVFLVAGIVLLRRERGGRDVLAGLVARDERVLAELAVARAGGEDAALLLEDAEGEALDAPDASDSSDLASADASDDS